MPTKIKMFLKYNHGEKSLKVPFTIYVDLECLLIKQQSCQNNPNESYTEGKAMHIPCGYALTQQTFVGLQDDLKTFSRHVLKTSSTRLQRNNFTSSKTS